MSGYSSGHIALFDEASSFPIKSWVASVEHQVKEVIWSKHRSSVFYAVLSNSTVLVWDLSTSSDQPILIVNDWETGGLRRIVLSTHVQGLLVSAAKQNVDIHILLSDLCTVHVGESSVYDSFIGNIFE